MVKRRPHLSERNPALWAELTGETPPESRPNYARNRAEEKEDRLHEAGYRNESAYKTDRQHSRDSSNHMSLQFSSRFSPDNRPDGMSVEEYVRLYADAWTRKDSFKLYDGIPNQARKDWFVYGVGLMTSAEWDAKYGAPEG